MRYARSGRKHVLVYGYLGYLNGSDPSFGGDKWKHSLCLVIGYRKWIQETVFSVCSVS